MMNLLIIFCILFFCELLYLKIAEKKKIIDKPNHRSAHTNPTIRGGGIIYLPALLLFVCFYKDEVYEYIALMLSVFIVAIISFIDDIKPMSTKVRMLVHTLAFVFVFYHLGLFGGITFSVICILLITYIFSLGYLNIYNFMDGINGVTCLNTLATFIGFLVVNENVIHFTSSNLIWTYILATLVFGFFNFRTQPKCFAGDVGSIAIGFTVVYFIIQLFIASENYVIFLFLSTYLLDGGWTVVERFIRKENVFEAHKRHLYQLYANEVKVPHLKISTLYFLVQVALNIVAIYVLKTSENNLLLTLAMFSVLSIIYFLIKNNTYKKIGNK